MAATLTLKADTDAYLGEVSTIVADELAAATRNKAMKDFAAEEAKAKNFADQVAKLEEQKAAALVKSGGTNKMEKEAADALLIKLNKQLTNATNLKNKTDTALATKRTAFDEAQAAQATTDDARLTALDGEHSTKDTAFNDAKSAESAAK